MVRRRKRPGNLRQQILGHWYIALLFPSLFLSDRGPSSAQADYKHAQVLFQQGHLARSEKLAEIGYARFQSSDPASAEHFQVLAAEDLLWQGMYDEAILMIAQRPLSPGSRDDQVRGLTVEASALASSEHRAEADEKLDEAERICRQQNSESCGDLPKARGVLAMKKGRFREARKFFCESLGIARSRSDHWMEANALLNLSAAALQDGHLDEANDWSKSAYAVAEGSGSEEVAQVSLGNLGWGYFGLGDPERALALFLEAEDRAKNLGSIRAQINWSMTAGYVYATMHNIASAKAAYGHALQLAQKTGVREDIGDILTVMALVEIASGDPAKSDAYSSKSLTMAQQSGSHPDEMDAIAVQMQAAALRGDTSRAEELLKTVETDPDSQTSMKWACEDAMARLYETNKQTAQAQAAYQSALNIFEAARAELQHEDSQLPFLANATRIYDDYIHFLVAQGKTQEALLVADQSRARTLAQGLGQNEPAKEFHTASFPPQAVARKAGATLLFYWLGERQSYLWAVTADKTTLFTLPPQREIAPLLDRYRNSLLGADDPLFATPSVGQALYTMLVAPAASLIRPNANVMILADGPLSLLNFETLIVPERKSGTSTKPSHYWIEDATLSAAPSLAMLATAKPERNSPNAAHNKLLLLGDAVSPGEDYPELPFAALEMQRVRQHFAAQDEVVFARGHATAAEYLASNPRQFRYIHFVSHGVASRTDPLDSAIILSRADDANTGEHQDSFKLYAREIMQHTIDARLVTISACNGSGTRAYAGEGLVGLSWAFLRAGAHSAIGALWEVSDNSTPQLMDALYRGLAGGQSPAAALRQAKLAMLHSNNSFRKPFYWAPFQIYTRM